MKRMELWAACLILWGCDEPRQGSAAEQAPTLESVSAPLPAQPPMSVKLQCLDGVDVRAALTAAGGTKDLRDRCAGEVTPLVADWGLNEIELDALIVTFIAYRSAPYGQSRAVTREALMTDAGLDCDNYVLLVEYLLRDLHPDTRLVFVGFDGGEIGNHAQALVAGGDTSVLLDPTVGVVARVGYNSLLKGIPLASDMILRDTHEPEAAVASLHHRVATSLMEGKYNPSDMLYYLKGVESMIALSEHAGEFWTPAKYPMLLLHYPTPGAEGLRKNLIPN